MSWEQLISIAQEQRQYQREEEEEARKPTACPNDGEPLTEGPNGEFHCRFDGWPYN